MFRKKFKMTTEFIEKKEEIITDSEKEIYFQTETIYDNIIKENYDDIMKKIKTKEDVVKYLPNIINSIDIGTNYELIRDDFIMTIKPSNSPFISNSTYVDFSNCEKILRNHNNISDSEILTFFQIEIKNKNEKSLVNQVEYEIYDGQKKQLNLSLCKDANIEIFYSIKSDSSLDITSIKSFKDLNIDILNLKDNFFTDICKPFSTSENDIILEDRIIDFYQNFSLCDGDCLYDEIDLDLMRISCNCSVKTNINIEEPELKLELLENVEKSIAFEIIKCHNLVFSWENKLKNIGFWIFLVLVTLHIPFLIFYFYKGIKPIMEYILKEMNNYGYLKKTKNIIKNIELPIIKACHHKQIYKYNNNKKVNSSSVISRLKSSDGDVVTNINKKDNNNKHQKKINNKKQKKVNFSKIKKPKKNKIKKKKKNKNISNITTQGIEQSQKVEIKKENNENNYINLNIININLNNINENQSITSNYILNIYSFKEAIKNDMRSVLRICYIYLLTKQAFFHAFLYRSPILLFPLRFCLLLFIISSDFALNALFYFDDKISEKYRYAKNILLFALTKNVTVILISTFIGFILLTLFAKLSNTTNDIRNVFKTEEEKIKKNKKYIVNDKRKKEIKKEIEKILKRYKIKVIIFFIIELLLIFCFV